ncbi:MAG: chromate transporter [Clostridia bacterium]|nr:chromate transporter [Clostridia bacterium]
MIYLQLFLTCFKIGLFTIGGGYAMIGLMSQAFVGSGLIDGAMFINMIAVAESTPGPIAVNLATFVGMQAGYKMGGVGWAYLGATVATIGVVLPSFIVMLIAFRLLSVYASNKYVKGALYGMRPAVIALMFAAVATVLLLVIFPLLDTTAITVQSFEQFDYVSLILFVTFLAVSRIKIKGRAIHPIALIGCSAVVGIIVFGLLSL